MSFVGKSVGNYRLESPLGAGAMGEVYLARHVALGRRAAVKILKPELVGDRELVQRFFQEAKVLASLGHPNLVDVVDYGVIDETVYLTMEFLEGRTLAEQVKGLGITVGEALHITAQICDALEACHSAGIIHRDLKPDNVFLTRSGRDKYRVKLLDFGVAKLVRGGTVKTVQGQLFGTPMYMSPEQAQGDANLDARTDLYSVGIILFEMLCGETPFEDSQSIREALLAHLTRAPARPSSKNPLVPASVDALVLKALEKKPERRFQTAREMMEAMQKPQSYWPSRVAPETLKGINVSELAMPLTLQGEMLSERRRSRRGQRVPRRNSWWKPAVAIGAVVVVAAIAMAVVASQSPAPAATVAKASRPKLLQVRVTSTPDGATVYQDGAEIGESPLTLSVRPKQTLELELRLRGYRTIHKQLLTETDTAFEVQLSPELREPEPPPSPPPETPAPRKRVAKSPDSKTDTKTAEPPAEPPPPDPSPTDRFKEDHSLLPPKQF